MSKTDVIIVQEQASELSSESKFDAFKLEYEFFNNFRSEHTKTSYRNDIKQFFNFLHQKFTHVQNIGQIERFHTVAYRNAMEEKEFAPKTINRKLSSLSTYFDFLIEKGFLESNPIHHVRRPRQEVLTPTQDLSDEEVTELFQAVKSKGSLLHQAIVYTFFTTGIRKSELINLRIKDLRQIKENWVIEIRAKGGKVLFKLLPAPTVKLIQNYLRELHGQGHDLSENSPLFRPSKNPSKEGASLEKKLRPKSVDYIIEKYCKLVGINHRVTPHSARATYIGSALESGVDIMKVAQDVGHSSIRTTQEYNKRRLQLKDSPVHSLGFLKDED